LELTESLLIQDSSRLSGLLRRLRGRGVGFSIDDFGTEYSNLGYLKRFEASRLKIDQSFIRRLTEDKHDKAIVRAIIQMTTSLQLLAIAEGVERASTLARLVEARLPRRARPALCAGAAAGGVPRLCQEASGDQPGTHAGLKPGRAIRSRRSRPGSRPRSPSAQVFAIVSARARSDAAPDLVTDASLRYCSTV